MNNTTIHPSTSTPTTLNVTMTAITMTAQASPALESKSSLCSFEPLTQLSVIVLTIAFSAIIVVSLIANTMVIRFAASRGNFRKPFNRLIVNMAAADLLDTVLGVPYNIVYFYIGLTWFPGAFGEFACKTVQFGTNISITASVFTLAAIAVDRYFAIAHCAKRPLSLRSVRGIIIMIWVISGMVFSSDYYRFGVLKGPNGTFLCLQDRTTWSNKAVQIDYIVKFVLNYAFPLIVMAILYGAITRFMWKRKAPGYANDNIEKKIHMQRRRSVKKLVIIVITFSVCWFPIHAVHFIAAFNMKLFFCTSIYLPLTCIWLAHANSAINPCLYLYLSHRSRMSTGKPIATF